MTATYSVLARRKVGWKNPSEEGKWPDFSDPDDFDDMWDWMDNDNMVQSPGLIDIPICSIEEAADNWRTTDDSYYSWPCDKP